MKCVECDVIDDDKCDFKRVVIRENIFDKAIKVKSNIDNINV